MHYFLICIQYSLLSLQTLSELQILLFVCVWISLILFVSEICVKTCLGKNQYTLPIPLRHNEVFQLLLKSLIPGYFFHFNLYLTVAKPFNKKYPGKGVQVIFALIIFLAEN